MGVAHVSFLLIVNVTEVGALVNVVVWTRWSVDTFVLFFAVVVAVSYGVMLSFLLAIVKCSSYRVSWT